MARSHTKRYQFHCSKCSLEFSGLMESVDVEHNGVWVAKGKECPSCAELQYPEGSIKPTDLNMVSDKDIRTGNWVHKLPSDWKELHNKIRRRNFSSVTTMEKL